MIDEWQQEVSDRMKKLKRSLETLRAQKKQAPDSEKSEMDALTKEVEELLKAIDKDKSRGVHNFIYAKRLTLDAEEKVLSAKKAISN